MTGPVRELRIAVTVEGYEQALAFYRDALGLPVLESWDTEEGSGAVLDAGRATLELLSRQKSELVDREPLDKRRRVLEHAEERLARIGVRSHARWHDDRVRTELPGEPYAHRGADAVRLRLVAGGENDARADDHRPPAQRGIVALLHGGIEGVDVGVQDRRLRAHERMFA